MQSNPYQVAAMFLFSPEGLQNITTLSCARGENQEQVVYSRKGAGK